MTSTIPPASPPPPQPPSRMTEETAHFITRSSTPVREFDNLGDVPAVAVLPEGRRMATASADGILRLWDLKNGVLLKELEGLGREMRSMALSRDGQLIASCDDGGNIITWDVDTGRRVTRGSRPHGYYLDFSPDGATLATAWGRMTKLWSTETWQVQGEPIDCGFSVNCVRYSPSGQLLSIATEFQSWNPKETIQIWNPATRQCIAKFWEGATSVSLLWTPDGTCLLSITNHTILQWDSSTWKQVGDIWKGSVGSCIAVNCNGTLVAYPTTCNQVCVRRLSDEQTIAIFQYSDLPHCVTFSVDGKHIFAGGKDMKISQWAVPKHAWPEDVPKDQAAYEARDYGPGSEDSGTKAQGYDPDDQDSETKIIAMSTTVRNACISGDLSTAEELLTQAIDANGDNYRSYAVRAVVMARKANWDNALRDAIKSISIQPSLVGYISKGISLCGKKQVRNANKAFDLASTFTDGDLKTIHFLFLVKAIALFNANQHDDAMRRVRELAAICPNGDTTLACRVVEVYLHIQLGNNALDRACPTEAVDHFTAAVNAGVFLTKSNIDYEFEDFVVLFGCDFTSLWQTANQKRCHALLRAGRLVEVFEACRYMADMSDESMKASCLNWTIGFMQEMSTFRDSAPKADATRNIIVCKYEDDDTNNSISDIDSDIDRVDDIGC